MTSHPAPCTACLGVGVLVGAVGGAVGMFTLGLLWWFGGALEGSSTRRSGRWGGGDE